MLPVVALGLIVIRKSGECEHDVAFFKRYALDASLIKGVLGRGERGRIDQRAACALIAHILEQLAGDVQLLFAAERQDAVIFHQHGAVGGKLSRQSMVRLPIHQRGIGRDDISVDPLQNAAASRIELLLRKSSVGDSVEYPPAADIGIAGHLYIQPCLQALHPVLDSAPVGHDDAVKAPLVPQDIGQQPFILRTKGAVDLIIRAHDRGGLRVFYDIFKGLEV